MDLEFIRYEKRDRIAYVTIDRPEVLNALHPPANEELSRVWDDFAADPRIDALRARMELIEDERYTADFTDASKRSSANAVQVHFRDGSSTDKVEVEYPAGHPRRRSEALPLLTQKFESALRRRFVPQRCARIAGLCQDRTQLERAPVHELVDLLRA